MTKERGGSIIFLAAGIYGLVFSIGLPLEKWNAPGPGVFPLSLSILLCTFGLVWFVQGRAKEGEKPRERLAGLFGKSGTPVRIVGITAAFIFLLEPLGYLLASMLYSFTEFSLISRYRLWIAATLAVTFGAGSWIFFTRPSTLPQNRDTVSTRDGDGKEIRGCVEGCRDRGSSRRRRNLPCAH